MKRYKHKNGRYADKMNKSLNAPYIIFDSNWKSKWDKWIFSEQELLDFWFIEEKDVYEKCADKILIKTWRLDINGSLNKSVVNILKEHFPQPTEQVIDMEEFREWYGIYEDKTFFDFLKHKWFTIVNE